MSIFVVMEYIIKPDKLAEYPTLFKKYEEWKISDPELFKEVRSMKVFRQSVGGTVGGYVEMWEFESLTDWDKWRAKYYSNKEALDWNQVWLDVIIPGTWSYKNIWNLVSSL